MLHDFLNNAGIGHTFYDAPGYREGDLSFTPGGIGYHHTGGANTSAAYCIAGRSNVPGPLYSILIYRSGAVHLLTEGRSNHYGSGDGFVVERMIVGKAKLEILPGADWGRSIGNRNTYGVSLQGTKSNHTGIQLEMGRRVLAAICDGMDWTQHHIRGHKEYTTRKFDPQIDMAKLRDDVGLLLGDDMAVAWIKLGDKGKAVWRYAVALNRWRVSKGSAPRLVTAAEKDTFAYSSLMASEVEAFQASQNLPLNGTTVSGTTDALLAMFLEPSGSPNDLRLDAIEERLDAANL